MVMLAHGGHDAVLHALQLGNIPFDGRSAPPMDVGLAAGNRVGSFDAHGLEQRIEGDAARGDRVGPLGIELVEVVGRQVGDGLVHFELGGRGDVGVEIGGHNWLRFSGLFQG